MTDFKVEKMNMLYETVAQSVSQGNFPHGVLVECENEQDGVDFAHYIANCLVCRGETKPCLKCADCLKAEKDGHPDIFETDGVIKSKSKILYGYWQNKDYIRQNQYVYVLESEKAVQQLATMGVRSCVSTGGKTISKYQVEEITRTGCTPIFAFDKDVDEEELQNIASMFMDGITVYAIIDNDNILDEKECAAAILKALEVK